MSLKDMPKLLHAQLKDIAAMCAGVALLLVAAVFVSNGNLGGASVAINPSASQVAATALGDTQGAPYPSYTGQTYPADTTCNINWSYTGYGGAPGPLCPTIGNSFWGFTNAPTAQPDTFSAGIFSVDLGSAVGQSVYQTRSVTAGYNYQKDMGRACPNGGSPTFWQQGDGGATSIVCYVSYGESGAVTGPTCPNGGTVSQTSGGENITYGTECYQSTWVPPVLSSPSINTSSGTTPVVGSGQSMTMEWSCLPNRNVVEVQHVSGTGGTTGLITMAGGWSGYALYSFNLTSSVTGSGSGFSPSGLTGTQTVTAPTTPGTYNYTLTCNGGTNAMTIPVTVIALPSITITGNATNPTTVVVGQPVTIVASFAASGSDTLTKTAINDNAGNLWCGSGNTCSSAMWTTAPLTTKTYTFTPAAPGPYLFTPSLQSANFSSWNNYGNSLTVTAVAACLNGSGPSGSCTACNSGFVLQGTAPTNSCVAQCPNGSGAAGSCTACNSGYVLQGTAPTNSCAVQCPANCPGATGAPNCTANSGYAYNSSNNTCVVAIPSISTFSISPTRVRKNTPTLVTFSYLVTNPPASCTISGPAGFTPLIITPISGVAGGITASVTISQTSTFTLTCGLASVQSTIRLVPVIQEI